MEDSYFLFFDDVKCILPAHQLNVLKQNEDGTFKLSKLPIVMSCSMSEFEIKVGPLVYILDKQKESELIEEYSTKVMRLESVGTSKYHIVAVYDKNSTSKKTDSDEKTRRFIRISNMEKYGSSDMIYVLKQNEDGTVSIQNAPIVIKNSILQYQLDNDCFLVAPASNKCDEEDIFELELTEKTNRYNFIRIYDKDSSKVKQLSTFSKKD